MVNKVTVKGRVERKNEKLEDQISESNVFKDSLGCFHILTRVAKGKKKGENGVALVSLEFGAVWNAPVSVPHTGRECITQALLAKITKNEIGVTFRRLKTGSKVTIEVDNIFK